MERTSNTGQPLANITQNANKTEADYAQDFGGKSGKNKMDFDTLCNFNLDPSEKKMADNQSVRIAVAGNVDSGKSTLVGVLTKGLVDDGRGSARLRVFNYPHEVENGRTSSVAQEIMGFNPLGEQVFASRFV